MRARFVDFKTAIALAVILTLYICSAPAPCAKAALWQDATPESKPPESQPAESQPASTAPAESNQLRFSFKDATFQQVIEYFSRATGLPVIWETPAPEGTLSYVSPRSYSREEALQVLNIILQSRGVMLRVDADMLYLQKLTDMQKENIPTFVGDLPEGVTADQIVTVVRPLRIASAKTLAEKLSPMVAEYGSVTSIDQQNALIITETAAQVRRLMEIVEELDRQDVEGQVEIFPIRNAKASALLESLKSLLSERVEKYVINQQGQQVKIEEESLPGLSLSADDRTNSIIAKGAKSRIDGLREAIDLLDVPASPRMRTMRTFSLGRVTAQSAAQHLNQLYEKLPKDDRPTVVTIDDLSKVTVIGDDAAVQEAEDLLRELDGWSESGNAGDAQRNATVINVVALNNINPNAAIQAVRALLNPQQQSSIRFVAGPDGRSVIFAGRGADVEAAKALLPAIDQPADQVGRMYQLSKAKAADVVGPLRELIASTMKTGGMKGSEPVIDALDRTNSIYVTAEQSQHDMIAALVQRLDQPSPEDQQPLRVLQVHDNNAVRIAELLRRRFDARPLQQKIDQPVEIDADDETNTLLVTAHPAVFDEITAFIENMNKAMTQVGETERLILPLEYAKANDLADLLDRLYPPPPPPRDSRGRTRWDLQKPRDVQFAADATSNTLFIQAPPERLNEFKALVAQLDRDAPPRGDALDVRVLNLVQAQANDVASAVQTAVRSRVQNDPSWNQVSVTAAPSANALVIAATTEQLKVIEPIVASLDHSTSAGQTQVRTVLLKHGRAERIAPIVTTLLSDESVDPNQLPMWARFQWEQMRQQAGSDQTAFRATADARLNAIVLAGSLPMLDAAEQLVAQLDVDPATNAASPQQNVRVLTIANADARQLASNIDAMFADAGQSDAPPPVVRVDDMSNSLIVRASDEQFKNISELVKKIDSATMATSRQMRLIPIDSSRAEAGDIARVLKQMMDRTGSKGVEVMTIDDLLKQREQNENKESAAPAPTSSSSSNVTDENEPPAAGSVSFLPHNPFFVFAMSAIGFVQDEEAASEPEEISDVTIAVDDATNSIVVVGSQRAVERITALVNDLQNQMPVQPGSVRYISMPAESDVRLITQMIWQTLWQMTPPGGNRGDIARRIAMIPDEAGNAVLVSANDNDFETVADLLTVLSRPPAAEPMIVKVYSLSTITADRAAGSLEQLLRQGQGNRQPQQGTGRELDMTLVVGEKRIEAKFDPRSVSASADSMTNSLIVTAPPHAIDFLDQYVSMIDETPANVQSTLKMYPMQYAKASDVAGTLRSIFRARGAAQRREPAVLQPEFASDERTNILLVTAAPEFLAEIDGLLEKLDRKLGEDAHPLKMINLTSAQPSRAAQMIDKIVVGNDQKRRETTTVVPDDQSGLLLVRASDEVLTDIDTLLKEIDRDATKEFEVRTIMLKLADAATVAGSLQRLYDDRAKIASAGQGRSQSSRKVSIIGDRASRTLLVAASDEDFAQISELVQQFDSPAAATTLDFHVYPLEHAKASDIQQTLSGLVDDLTWNQGPTFFWGWNSSQNTQQHGTLAVRADNRLNAIIVTGEGDKFQLVDRLIEMLDAPQAEGEQRVVRMYRVKHADVELVVEMLNDVFSDPNRQRRWWEPADPTEPRIRVDEGSKTILVSASQRQQEEMAGFIKLIDEQTAPAGQTMQVLTLQYGRASNIARTIQQFLNNRARATNAPDPSSTIVPSDAGNALIVSATEEDFALINDLLKQLDTSDLTGDRDIEIIALKDGDADEIARMVREQFGSRGEQAIRVTADRRTNSLIINSPKQQMEQVQSLIARLDAPSASDETIVRTFSLTAARADEAKRMLSETLQLDSSGKTDGITIKLEDVDGPGVEVKARIVADRRSNSLIITATEQSFPVLEALIAKIDNVPTVSPVEYRTIPLEHAVAADVAYTLRQFTRGAGGRLGGSESDPEPRIDYNRIENQIIVSATAAQFEQIQRIVKELDVASERQRITDFVPLQFAQAEQVQEALSVFYGPFAIEADTPGKINARIVADPATNSLVISADEGEWTNIRALLKKLDSEEYDSSLQLKVMPLKHADAASVARGINEAFQTTVQRPDRNQPNRGARQNNLDDRREIEVPTVLVQTDEWVRAAAETQTNSVIVSASRQNMRKVEQIIEQLDVADYATLPPPRFIPVHSGDPEALAQSINQLYVAEDSPRGTRSLRIVGDKSSNTVIVRAEDDEFQQIAALAEALQQHASTQGLTVHVLRLTSAPATRVKSAIEDAFSEKAKQSNQPLSIQVDAAGNSLVIASTGGLFEEIKQTAEQLDALAPAPNQSIFIIELENVSPDEAIEVIHTIGLDQQQPVDSVSRLVTDPIRATALRGRQAIVIVANPVDRQVVIGLLKSIDAEPQLAESAMRVVKLKNAEASALLEVLNQILNPTEQQVQTSLAQALQEQVRRLAVERDGVDEQEFQLDLTKPIRVVADTNLNALVVSSTETNVKAMTELIGMFDALPITDAVTIRVFPLENIAAAQFARIVNELFTQGKRLQGVPGTAIQGIPGGALGKALLDNVAISVDERTNTVVVAGKEDAVAFVEVLSQRLDTDIVVGWVEPRIVPLRFADAGDLAETLNAIIVEGSRDLPQSTPLQDQVGRLRMARIEENGGHVIESEVFQPMNRLVIRGEPQLNAIILVGTPENNEIVSEMIAMLDVEAASPNATVRIYPVKHASAARLATTVQRLFDQQIQSRQLRAEDRVIIEADERTNSLVVTTSPRSFGVFEHLLSTLDTDVPPDIQEIRQIDLEFASATRLAQLAQEVMDARMERLRRVQPQTADMEKATIVAEPRTNSLIIAASNESFAIIQQLVKSLDVSTLSDDSLIDVFEIEKGNIDRIASAVNAIMDRRYADMPAEMRTSQKPLILPEPRTNSVMVAANPEDLAAIGRLIDKLENTEFNPAVGIHVLPVQNAQAEQIAPRLQRLMRERQQSLGQASTPSDAVTIEPDAVSNALIVAANDENMQVIMRLIDALTTAQAEGIREGEFEIITLSRMRAGDVIDLLNDLYVREENRRRGDNTIQVSGDERLNAVLVHAPQRDVAEIRRLIAQLDGAKPSTVVEIKYIPLNSANAIEMVGLIETVLSGRGIGTRGGAGQATVLKYLHEIAEQQLDDEGKPLTEMEVSAAIRESISLTPDVRTNTIIVRAPRDSMQMIEQMIRDLDQSSVGSKNIRIFKLTNADATGMAQILTDLFNLRQGNNLLVLKPREQLDGVEGTETPSIIGTGGPLSGTELTAVPDERQQLSITVDSRTNSLLVSGTPRYLDLVAQVVEELDNIEANERDTFVYALRNSEATEVARVIGEFVAAEQRKLIETLSTDQLGSAARLLEREVTIVGDEKSNTVLVSASPRYLDRVKEMINELDVDPPQVLIQVLLAEVTLNYGDEWGVDLEAMFEVGSATVTGGYGLASAFVGGLGAPSLSIASSDFDLLIKALQSQGRLQVLSNPSVMAANNEPALIQVGETIRVPESTSFTDTQQRSEVVPEDIGIILNVTPSINPDGFVRMTVQPEISELSARTTQISEDFQSPIITRRKADTTITVADGQTIVIGGLISDRYELRTEKVPFLGDIPFVGALFRSDTETATKTEFLIVLTPYVVRSPAEMNDVTDREVDRLSVPEHVKEEIRKSMLEGRLYDADGKLISPDQHSQFEGDLDPILEPFKHTPRHNDEKVTTVGSKP